MGYYVPKEKSTRGWYIEFEGGGLRKRVGKEHWPKGIHEGLTITEARAIAKAINKVDRQQSKERSRLVIRERLASEAALKNVYLPEALVKDFEARLRDLKIRLPHWHTAQKAIIAMAAPPEDWGKRPTLFYDWCAKRSYSLDYIGSVRRILNLWGDELTELRGTRYKAIGPPTGAIRNELLRAYEAYAGRGRPSGRLSFALLEASKDKFTTLEYNWLFITIAFGLRPEEMTKSLIVQGKSHISNRGLHVYQYKAERFLTKEKDRWKLIPLHIPEQTRAITMIREQAFKRPSREKLDLKDARGRRITYYGGRKEFFPMMRKRGFDEAAISRWMGHKTVDVARKHYDDVSDAMPWDDDGEEAA